MKKISNKFKVLLIIIVVLIGIFVVGNCKISNASEYSQNSSESSNDISSVFPDSNFYEYNDEDSSWKPSENYVKIIKNLPQIIIVLVITVLVIRFIIMKKRLYNENLAEKERIDKNKELTKKFKKQLVITIVIGLFVIGIWMIIRGDGVNLS